MDIEKMIQGVECHAKGNCGDCPYREGWHACKLGLEEGSLFSDLLSLLKAQEPIKPVIDFDGENVWRCRKCGAELFRPFGTYADEDTKSFVRYCCRCGKMVKWNA